MLPPVPPPISSRDFDPAALHDQDEEMEEEEVEEGSRVELSSVEINILIYLYLLESNLPHTAFTLLSESSLPSTSLFQHFNPSYPTPSSASSSSRAKPNSSSSAANTVATPGAAGANGGLANGILGNSAANGIGSGQNGTGDSGQNGAPRTGPGSHAFGSAEGRIQRGELIRKLWKGLRWEEVERHVSATGEAYTPQCPNPFHLLIPHSCPAHYPSAVNNPAKPLPAGLRVSPPPPEARLPEAFPDPVEPAKTRTREDAAEDKAEAGPSRPRNTATSSNSAKRPRTIRASSEDRDEARTPVSRRSASPDVQARREKRDAAVVREKERPREKDREGKRPRVSDLDTDKERERERERGRDRDEDTSKAKEKEKEGERKTVKSGKDKERDRDREKDRDKDKDKDRPRVKDKERERDRDREKEKGRIPKMAAADDPEHASREDSPAVKRKRDREEVNTTTSLAPPRKAAESRSKSPASTASGPLARQANGNNTTGTASSTDKSATPRGPGRPPKNAGSVDTKPSTTKRSRLIDSPPTESPREATPAPAPAPAKVVRRGKGNPAWIDDDDVAVFIEHKDAVSCLAWNPRNPSVLATGSSDGSARLWEFTDPPGLASTGAEDVDMDDPSASTSKTLTLTDKILVRHPSIDSTRKTLSALAWHPEGSMLATGCLDGVGRLITPDGQIVSVMTYGSGAINGLKFSPDGRWVLTPKSDFSVGLWSVGKGVSEGVKSSYTAHTSDVNDVDWLDDDVFASGANDHRIYVFRTTDKTVRYTFRGHTDDVTRVKWSPSPIPGSDKTATNPPASGITPAQSVKANHLLASVSDDGYLMIWRMPSYPLERVTKSSSRSVSPVKGGYNLSAPGDADERDRGKSRDRDSKEGLLDAHGANGSTGNAGDAAASTAGGTGSGAAGAGAGPGTGQNGAQGHGPPGQQSTAGLPDHCIAKIRVSEPDDRRLNVLEWAPTGSHGEMIVAAGAEDSPVKLFNVLTSELLHTLPGLQNGVRCLAFSKLLGGRLMLAAAGWFGQLNIYDVRTGENKGEWAFGEDNKGKDRSIRAMAWREDGQYLAVCNGNKAVALLYTGGVLAKMSADGPLIQPKQEIK